LPSSSERERERERRGRRNTNRRRNKVLPRSRRVSRVVFGISASTQQFEGTKGHGFRVREGLNREPGCHNQGTAWRPRPRGECPRAPSPLWSTPKWKSLEACQCCGRKHSLWALRYVNFPAVVIVCRNRFVFPVIIFAFQLCMTGCIFAYFCFPSFCCCCGDFLHNLVEKTCFPNFCYDEEKRTSVCHGAAVGPI
jgi:hypothetical protein